MKRIAIFIASLFAASAATHGATLLIEGKYQNKNIYVQNAPSDNGVGFCAYEVRVNDQVTTDEIASSAFEIDLSNFSLKPGDKVEIKINHKDGCTPKVLNPDALKPKPTFNTVDISISAGGLLTWKTSGEVGSLPFVIEQFRWNKWVYVGEVQGEGTPGEHTYSFQTTPHSGENKFRVKQVGYNREVRLTPERAYVSQVSAVSYTESDKKKNNMIFSSPTMYEVYDAYGNIVLKGFGTDADLTPFEKGIYYLCFDNQIATVKRR